MREDLEAAKRLAIRAGSVLLEHYVQPKVRWKGRGNPVTEADCMASALLVKQLKRMFPGDGILSEEEPDELDRLGKSRVWIVDPLDGTMEFINRLDEFAVMIGLSVDGISSLGIVYQPATEKLYYAELGSGTFLTENGTTRLLQVSRESKPLAMTIALSRSHHTTDVDLIQRELGITNTISCGSIGLKVGLICEGRAHLYLHTSSNTSQWDTCAADVILHEAGGRMTDLSNVPLRYNGSEVRNLDGVIASTGIIHDQIAKAAQAVFEKKIAVKTTLDIQEKVAFLSKRQSYPDGLRRVEIRQTHMSWVFLTDKYAWKLKKPVRTEYFDFSTPEARRRNCLRETRLNRRLAKNVYLGVVPLTVDRYGNFQLHGNGKTVDWLVCMRRLPSDRMLDSLIACHDVSKQDVLKLASTLADFYKKEPPVSITTSQYRKRLDADLESARRDLTRTEYGLDRDLAESVIRSLLEFLGENHDVFDARVRERRIIEGHGDLRPEHVCLEAQPVIIDCLEFNRDLRILDAASELAFLALECERLGAPNIGKQLLKTYSAEADDWPSDTLMGFYRAYHAVVRAKIAVWHLKDDAILDGAKWLTKADQYIRMAVRMSKVA